MAVALSQNRTPMPPLHLLVRNKAPSGVRWPWRNFPIFGEIFPEIVAGRAIDVKRGYRGLARSIMLRNPPCLSGRGSLL